MRANEAKQPDKRAIELARNFLCMDDAEEDQEDVLVLAMAFTRYADEKIAEERSRCEKVADEDAELGRLDLHETKLHEVAGARILAAERIAMRIRRPEIPSILKL